MSVSPQRFAQVTTRAQRRQIEGQIINARSHRSDDHHHFAGVNADAGSVAWRTALYRMAVDVGIFLGPLFSGFLLGHSLLGAVGVVVAATLAALGLGLLLHYRAG